MAKDVDRSCGLYEKFTVQRTDGESRLGRKHFDCEYFVLDLTHDPYAVPAILAYAATCKREFPVLAADLKVKAEILIAKSKLIP